MTELKAFHEEIENIVLDFKDGFACTEILAGTCQCQKSSVHIYRCALKAGAIIKKKVDEETVHTLFLTNGLGAVVTSAKSFAVDEPSVFVPDFCGEYMICASTDMSYTVFIVDLKEEDIKYNKEMTHYTLPFFVPISQGVQYTQTSCKTKNCISRSIITPTYLQPMIVGAVEFSGDREGTFEKGHYCCEQWNLVYGADSRVVIDIEGDRFIHKDGDISYIPGGLDHNLYTEGNTSGKYVFFEYFLPEEVNHKE